MNRKLLILQLLLLFTLLALAACKTEVSGERAVDAAGQSGMETAVAASVADCPPVTPGTQQLIDAAQGICFLYPDDYDVSQSTENAFGLYVQSPLNTEAPLASISFEAANQFDQVPGQDLSRQVLMVHNGRLYNLTFIPDDPDAGAAYDEMQLLYDMVMDTFSLFWQ